MAKDANELTCKVVNSYNQLNNNAKIVHIQATDEKVSCLLNQFFRENGRFIIQTDLSALYRLTVVVCLLGKNIENPNEFDQNDSLRALKEKIERP